MQLTFVTQWMITFGAAGVLLAAALIIKFIVIPRVDQQAAKDKTGLAH